MTDLEVWLIGASLLISGVLILAISLTGLVALGQAERRQRQAVERRRLLQRWLDRDTEQTIRQVQQHYEAAMVAAVRRTTAVTSTQLRPPSCQDTQDAPRENGAT